MANFSFGDLGIGLTREFDKKILRAKPAAARKVQGRGRARSVLVSEQAGCLPNQVAEANENCRRLGIQATYRPDGTVEYGGPKARRKHLKELGFIDRKSFY